MLFGKKLIVSILSITVFVPIMLNTSLAKSVYVIIDRYSTVRAYLIEDDQIEYQINAKNLADHGTSAVGLALDPDTAILFVTYEVSNIIEMVNAKTMISEQNPVTVMEACNLSGMAFDPVCAVKYNAE